MGGRRKVRGGGKSSLEECREVERGVELGSLPPLSTLLFPSLIPFKIHCYSISLAQFCFL